MGAIPYFGNLIFKTFTMVYRRFNTNKVLFPQNRFQSFGTTRDSNSQSEKPLWNVGMHFHILVPYTFGNMLES
jgi:hypothetical protein